LWVKLYKKIFNLSRGKIKIFKNLIKNILKL